MHLSRGLLPLWILASIGAAAPALGQGAPPGYQALPMYDGVTAFTPSSLSEGPGTLAFLTDTTAQIKVAAGGNAARFGEDTVGAFIASDAHGKPLRLLTTDAGGHLGEWARLTSAGIFSFTPAAATSGEIAIAPDGADVANAYPAGANGQMHFRLSRGACNVHNPVAPGCDLANPSARDFLITPYSYGIAQTYPGTLEFWVQDFSVHADHQGCLKGFSDCNAPASFWVGDETDSGGLHVTSHDRAAGVGDAERSYTAISSETFVHGSHGWIYLQVRDPADGFSFRAGPQGAEQEVASIDASGAGRFSQGLQSGGSGVGTLMCAGPADDDGHPVTYEVGDVLVIDPRADRRVMLTDDPYSRLVAGVYNDGPALLASPSSVTAMGAATLPMVTSGITRCKVSAENGPIRRGDLLVTAHHDGYAMRGKDGDRMVGAVLGKALQELPSGTGLIDILVTLQ